MPNEASQENFSYEKILRRTFPALPGFGAMRFALAPEW
jgi:hypothetical protein